MIDFLVNPWIEPIDGPWPASQNGLVVGGFTFLKMCVCCPEYQKPDYLKFLFSATALIIFKTRYVFLKIWFRMLFLDF